MKLDALRPLLDHPGPLTTVCLDVTRAETASDRELRSRWNGLRRELEHRGAPAAALDLIGEAVLRPTHLPGPRGRFVVASATEVLLDRVLAAPPVRDEVFHDGTPSLMPAAHAADEAVRLLLVEVDRTGADLSWFGPDRPAEIPDHVEGGHDVVHKVAEGGRWGWSSRRLQARVEDSWERNAEVVAAELDRLVDRHRPELVAVTGDVRAVGLVRDALGRPAAELVVEVPGGSRAQGVKEDVLAERLAQVVQAHRARRREQVVDRLREGLGRGDGAVTSLDDVVEVLRRGQVAELVVVEDAAGVPASRAERELWVGGDPLQLGVRGSELDDLGVADPRRVRADIALLRAAIAQDAGVTFALEGSVDLADGLGAVLRWSDAATPHETAPASTADTERRRRAGTGQRGG